MRLNNIKESVVAMKVLSVALIKKTEKNAVNSGNFSYKDLMKNAGKACAKEILKNYNCQNKKIAVICGNGNNGGDGFVVAKELENIGAKVTVIIPFGVPQTKTAKYYFEKLGEIPVTNKFSQDFDIIIDALFGIGLNRPLNSDICDLINDMNSSNAIKIAVDIPSGIEANSGKILGAAFKADLTVTFIAPKPCFFLPYGNEYCGKLTVADIGVKLCGYSYTLNQKPIFEKRPKNSHKGTFGTALLLCGSYGMAGASILSTRAALRSGVGIAKIVVCESIYQTLTLGVPEAVCVPVKENSLGTLTSELPDKALEKTTAVLFGCGVGLNNDTKALLEKLIEKVTVPFVIDADGINALASRIDILKNSKAPIILTPHPAEMARLCKKSASQIEENRIETAKTFAKDNNCFVVLKGANTIISSPEGEICINTNGNPGLAKGGSGDVLAGIIVSLLAQGLPTFDAIKAAVYLHSEAADKALLKRKETSILASDIIEEL